MEPDAHTTSPRRAATLLAGGALVAILVAAILFGPQKAADPEYGARAAYVRGLFDAGDGADASGPLPLASNDRIEFLDGWTYLSWQPDPARAFRAAHRTALVRLRADRAVPMRVRLRAWVPPERAGGSLVLTYSANGVALAARHVTTQEYEHVVHVPASLGWIDFGIVASTWALAINGSEERAFELRAFAWEEDPDPTGGAPEGEGENAR